MQIVIISRANCVNFGGSSESDCGRFSIEENENVLVRLLVCCAISVHCPNVVQLLDTGRLDYVKDEGAAPVNE